jgi:predicted transposase YbfD/YdcC
MREVNEREVKGIISCFEELPDPRSHVNRRHLLVDVIVISICAVLANADGPAAIEVWAKLNQDWLKKYLRLPNGIPSHDTIGRVFEALTPQAFQKCFAEWIGSLVVDEEDDKEVAKKHVAIDGKTMRRSHDRSKGLGALHIVSAWATERGVSMGQIATEEKSNEITAIPELLGQLDIENAIITIDAAGCQKDIAEQIVKAKGDYVLALKANHPTLHAAVHAYFLDHVEDDFRRVAVSRFQTREKSHGRMEYRSYYQLKAPRTLPGYDEWKGLRSIGVAVRIYEVDGVQRSDVRYYLSSLRRNGKQFARAVRGHWGIENTLHWCLDMTYREDESRIRKRNHAQNISWLRRMTLSLIKQHPSKQSNIMKRRMAGWSLDFLMQLLTGKAT